MGIYSGVLKPQNRQTVYLFLFLLVLYAALPTRNHYWDGIGFALNIEGTPQDGSGFVLNPSAGSQLPRIYCNPNHLLPGFCNAAPLDWQPSAQPLVDAADGLLGHLVEICYRRRHLHSASIPAHSCDMELYSFPSYPTGGFAPCPSMLLHQIAIWCLPAALYAVWRQTRSRSACLRYLCAAGVPVAASYAIVWIYVLNDASSVASSKTQLNMSANPCSGPSRPSL